MTKKKIIKRSSGTLTYGKATKTSPKSDPSKYTNEFDIGGALSGVQGKIGGIMGGNKLSTSMGGAVSALGNAAGQIGGSLIGGGLQSGAGSAISNIGGTIGSAVGAVNPLLGGVISAGSGIIGGLTNRAFGSKMNQEKINDITTSNNAINQTMVDSSSNESVASQWGSMDLGTDFTKKDIGSDGWFSSKAANKYKELALQQNAARNRAMQAFNNAADTADMNMDLTTMRNYSAYGGPIEIASNAPMSPFGNRFAEGGSIHINPANRGKFNATKRRTGKSTEELTHSKNPLTRKRAIFAQNASHWHALGGVLQGEGADWNTGLIPINSGGTHEENPNDGVQMGVDDEGTPNLVEQGEVKWNDYIFSNRLTADKSMLQKAYLPTSLDNHTFAAAAENLGRESKERPNDPISQRGLTDSLTKLEAVQEAVKQKEQQRVMKKDKKYACGGHLYADGGYEMPFVKRADGTYPVDDNTGIGTYGKDWGPIGQHPYSLNPAQVPAQTDTWVPPFKAQPTRTEQSPYLSRPQETDTTKPPTNFQNSGLAGLRFAPAIGSGLMALSDAFGWTNKPNYSSADSIQDSVSHIKPVTYTPLGNYLNYTPFDRNYYTNKLGAQASATKRSIVNQAGGNRATAIAGLLAADYNAEDKLGDLFRQSEEYNQGLKERVETFNRGTDQYNSEAATKAQVANQATDRLKFEAALQAASLRDQADARSAAARSANLSNLFENLGGIGVDAYNRNDRNALIRSGVFGAQNADMLKNSGMSKSEIRGYYKGLGLSDDEIKARGYAKGGKLKRKRGLTC